MEFSTAKGLNAKDIHEATVGIASALDQIDNSLTDISRILLSDPHIRTLLEDIKLQYINIDNCMLIVDNMNKVNIKGNDEELRAKILALIQASLNCYKEIIGLKNDFELTQFDIETRLAKHVYISGYCIEREQLRS